MELMTNRDCSLGDSTLRTLPSLARTRRYGIDLRAP